MMDHRSIMQNFVLAALAHLQLARAKPISADDEGARKAYQNFLTLWKDADHDIPILKAAKAEYAKLQYRVPTLGVVVVNYNRKLHSGAGR